MNKLAFTVLAALILQPYTFALACGDTTSQQASDVSITDLSWIKSELTIYGLDEKGLYETRINSIQQKRLVKSDAAKKTSLMISPDGRYIFYSISDNEIYGKGIKYYLFNTMTKSTREIKNLPPNFGLGELRFVGFSPDSKHIAWQNNGSFDDFQNDRIRPELIIYSTATLKQKRLKFPAFFGRTGNAQNCFKSQWSVDSSAIYSNYMYTKYNCSLPEKDEHNLIYFKANIISGSTAQVDGGYSFNRDGRFFKNHYLEEGKEIQLSYPCSSRRNCGLKYGDHYVDGDSHAYFEGQVDGDQNLFIRRGKEEPVKIETGHSSSCSGSDIRIVSWIENGKYLIYAYSGNSYIYGVEEKRRSLLPQLTGTYNWLPYDTSQITYTDGSSQKDSTSPILYSPSDMWD